MITAECNGKAGKQVVKTAAYGRYAIAAENADVHHYHEGNNEAVNALSCGKSLKQERLTELGGVLGEKSVKGFTDRTDRFCASHTGKDDGKRRADEGKSLTCCQRAKKFSEIHGFVSP